MSNPKIGFLLAILVALGSSETITARTAVGAQEGSLASQENPFTNDDVVRMVEAGFAKATVIEAIRSHAPGFDTSTEALIDLKNAGIEEDIIVEMLAASRAEAERPAGEDSETDDGLPSEDGVYALLDGVYVPLSEERIEWRSGLFSGITTRGSLKTTAFNARLKALHSPFEVSSSPELLVVCEECESAFDYHLVLANDDDDKREFRISFQILEPTPIVGMPLSGDRYVSRGGTGKEKMEFDAETVAPGKFKLVLPELTPGEYGLLPPSEGDHPQSSTGSVMYTFRLTAT